MTNDIHLSDDDDNYLGRVWDLEVPLTGYPFDGKAGSNGNFTVVTTQGGAP